MEEIGSDEEVLKYLPEITAKTKMHNKAYVMTVVASLRPQYVKALVEHAYSERAREADRPADT